MDEATRAALKDALARELVALGALALILFAMGPGRTLVPAWIARARTLMAGRDAHEGQVRQFAREVSEWDHEQTARANRKPATGGGCGCG